ITNLRQKYIDLDRFVAENSEKYGSDQGYVERARADMQQLVQAMLDEMKRIAEGYRSEASIAEANVKNLTEALDQLASQSSGAQQARGQLAKLQSTAEALQRIRDDFMARSAEVAKNQSFPITEARIVATAPVPTSPAS